MSIKYEKLKIFVWSMALWNDVPRRYMQCFMIQIDERWNGCTVNCSELW